MRRIHVVGTSGSGKTTVASTLARRLGVPHVELDAWAWTTHARNRERYARLLADVPFRVVRLQSRAEVDRWLLTATAG